MAQVITAVSGTTALMSCGGFRDNKNLAVGLAAAAGLTFATVTGGGNLLASTIYVVLDGQTVTLPAGPADTTIVGVINALPAVTLTVSAGAGDTTAYPTISGSAGAVFLKYASGTKIWSKI
jgi:hypothetical protein